MGPIEKAALTLYAQALERDSSDSHRAGDTWLDGQLAEHLAHAFGTGFANAVPPLPKALLHSLTDGFAERAMQQATGLICGQSIASQTLRQQMVAAEYSLPQAVVAVLHLGLGLREDLAPVVAAKIMRRVTQPNLDLFCAEWATHMARTQDQPEPKGVR